MTAPPPFSRFLEDHREAVYRFLLATVGPDEADDCFQETFIKALRAYPRLTSADNLRGWALTIARRTAIDAARGRGRRPAPASDLEPPAPDGTPEPRRRRALGCRPRPPAPPARGGDAALRERPLLRRDRSRDRSSEEAARRSAFEGVRRLREVWNG